MGLTQCFLHFSTFSYDCSNSTTAGFLIDELLSFTQQKAIFAPHLLLSSRIMGPCQLPQTVLTTTFWFFHIILLSDFFLLISYLAKTKKPRKKQKKLSITTCVSTLLPVPSIRFQLFYWNNINILISRASVCSLSVSLFLMAAHVVRNWIWAAATTYTTAMTTLDPLTYCTRPWIKPMSLQWPKLLQTGP